MYGVGDLVDSRSVDELQPCSAVDDPVDVDSSAPDRPRAQLVVLGHAHQTKCGGSHSKNLYFVKNALSREKWPLSLFFLTKLCIPSLRNLD